MALDETLNVLTHQSFMLWNSSNIEAFKPDELNTLLAAQIEMKFIDGEYQSLI